MVLSPGGIEQRYGHLMAVLAVPILRSAVAIWIVVGGLALALGYWVRTWTERKAVDNNDDHKEPQGPTLQIGPQIGWYIRAVDWPDTDLWESPSTRR